jgi:hypothetical protein
MLLNLSIIFSTLIIYITLMSIIRNYKVKRLLHKVEGKKLITIYLRNKGELIGVCFWNTPKTIYLVFDGEITEIFIKDIKKITEFKIVSPKKEALKYANLYKNDIILNLIN